ncbi:oxysterol-binding protein-related protein 1-like, partial [Bombina bombina]|uniref:oxysterol-binding protein-related protein 1-like n=1 Tax=Bombina bombina TaxID=8345 RepID=UPI00235AD61A
ARTLKLEHEQEKNKILSEALQTLATEHHELEQSLVKGSPPHHSILSDDEFYDALSDSESDHSLSGFETVTSYSQDESVNLEHSTQAKMSDEKNHGGGDSTANGIKKHRTSLPSPMFSRNDFSIWSILRKCIGMMFPSLAVTQAVPCGSSQSLPGGLFLTGDFAVQLTSAALSVNF